MQNEPRTTSTARRAPLAQVALAALVAGSLLTFSTIAFHTAFDEPPKGRGVTVSSPRTEPAAPVVLPTPPDDENNRTAGTAAVVAEIVATNAPDSGSDDLNDERSSKDKDGKDKDEASEPRIALPWPGSSRTLSGYDKGDNDAKHGKAHGHGKGKNGHGKGHLKGKGKGHGHKNKGHGHTKGEGH